MTEEQYPVQPNEEEEYQFNELEDADLFGVEPARKPWQEYLKQPKVLISIGLAVAAFLFSWLLISLVSKEPEQKPEPQAKVEAAPAINPNEVNQLHQELTALALRQREYRNHAQYLEQRVATLAQQLTELKEENAKVADVLEVLIEQLIQQTQQLEKLAQAQKTNSQATNKKTAIKEEELPTYYVQAMIPGRAWLFKKERGTSTTLTVARGDSLPGYGQITAIDPSRGVVITNSGKVIGYEPGDS